ncbi:hypothetical protein M5K25_021672 [Dendrobium thyrsiflorum]|uniref:Uncharacterized protein n=1 Tax=Dendrobium thyrsiflorum TaxID=117978 RepID=A0ABD0UAE2_DENTH
MRRSVGWADRGLGLRSEAGHMSCVSAEKDQSGNDGHAGGAWAGVGARVGVCAQYAQEAGDIASLV